VSGSRQRRAQGGVDNDGSAQRRTRGGANGGGSMRRCQHQCCCGRVGAQARMGEAGLTPLVACHSICEGRGKCGCEMRA
jgi:hypothetical protein